MKNKFHEAVRGLLLVLSLLLMTPTYAFATNSGDEDIAQVPIIMYHLITEKPKYIGKYGITPKELESDLAYLKENGYTTVVMRDLIDYVQQATPLPNKPIVLTFDDGNYSDYQYLYPLLQKYEMKAVLAIIGEATDKYTKQSAETPTARYPNLNWLQARELHESGVLEIQSHGYNMHGRGGSGEKRGESIEVYHARLYDDLKKLQDLCKTHIGHEPDTFVYPLGVVGKESRKVLEKLGMKASLSCQEGINVLHPGSVDKLFQMYRYNRPSGKSIKYLLEKMK